MNFKMLPDEKVIFEGKANRIQFLVIGQGGTLYLTNKRLVFVGHGMNIGEGTISIELEDVLSFRKALACGILIPIPNSLKVTNKQGKTHKFVVTKRKHWIKELGKAING